MLIGNVDYQCGEFDSLIFDHGIEHKIAVFHSGVIAKSALLVQVEVVILKLLLALFDGLNEFLPKAGITIFLGITKLWLPFVT